MAPVFRLIAAAALCAPAVLLQGSVLAVAPPAAAQTVCADFVQGRIAWVGGKDTSWTAANLAALCKGAETSIEPGKCFKRVMSGTVSYGGGTSWNPANALRLCAGALDANARVTCFEGKIGQGIAWAAATAQCVGTGTAAPAVNLGSVSQRRVPTTKPTPKPGVPSMEVEVPKKKANGPRAVQEDDYRKRAEPLPRVQRAKASELGKTTKSTAASVTSVVSDSVLKTGSKISGGWREYAADLSWRRVVFTLDGRVGTIVFSDGKPGSLLPAVTHFARSGPGPKGSPATYDAIHIFPGTTPVILDKAKQSSQFPSGIATRIREFGGDIKVMQQLADIKRIAELASAFDAMRNPAGAGGFFADRPGGPPGEGHWRNPRSVAVGRCPGCASDDGDVVVSSDNTRDADGNRSSSTTTRHADNSTTTESHESNTDGSSFDRREEKDADGNRTYIRTEHTNANGDSFVTVATFDSNTGETRITTSIKNSDGSFGDHTNLTAPPETPYSGRGGFDEAWLARLFPWMMDAHYVQWKRESDLVKSGGRIAQPGRGEQPTLVLNEGPEVGVEGVVNCGAETNPCARTGGVEVDTGGRRLRGRLSQPGRGVSPGPIDGKAGPRPIPVPSPRPQ